MQRFKQLYRALFAGGVAGFAFAKTAKIGLATETPKKNESDAEMWIWGNGVYTPTITAEQSFADFTPFRKIGSLASHDGKEETYAGVPRFTSVAAFEEIVCGIADNKVYSFLNERRKSYDKHPKLVSFNNKETPESAFVQNLQDLKIPKNEKPVKLGLIGDRVWVLTEAGNVYSRSVERGKEHLSGADETLSEHGHSGESKSTGKHGSHSGHHSGDHAHGSSGHSEKEHWSKYESVPHVKDISFGRNHILFLAADGKVWAAGNNAFGQLGSAPTKEYSQEWDSAAAGKNAASKIEALNQVKVTNIYSNGDHSFVVTDKNDFIGFGSNVQSQLGGVSVEASNKYHSNPNAVKPHSYGQILTRLNCNLQNVVLGSDFTFLQCINTLSGAEQLHGIGANSKGELSVIPGAPCPVASEWVSSGAPDGQERQGFKLPSLKKMMCGNSHCIALGLLPGQFWVWGENSFGQLGNKTNFYSFQPDTPPVFVSKNIQDAFASDNVAIAYVRKGSEKSETPQTKQK